MATFNSPAPSVTVQVPVPRPVQSSSPILPLPKTMPRRVDREQVAARLGLRPQTQTRKPTALIFPHGLEQGQPQRFARRRTPAPTPPEAPPGLHAALIGRLSPDEQQELKHPRVSQTFHSALTRALAGGRGSVLPAFELQAMSEGGQVVRGEYRRAYQALARLLGEHNAQAWWQANAILSSQMPWASHTEGALKALAKFLAAKPKSRTAVVKLFQHGGGFSLQNYTTNKAAKLIDTFDRLRREGSKFKIEPREIGQEGTGKTIEFASAGGDPNRFPADVHMWSATDPVLSDTAARERLHQHYPAYAAAVAAINSNPKLTEAQKQAATRKLRTSNLHGEVLREHDRLMGSKADRSAYKAVGLHVGDLTGHEPREIQESAWADILAARVAKAGEGHDADPKRIAKLLTRPAHQAAWDMYKVLFHDNRPVLVAAAEAVGKTPKHVEDAGRDYLLDRRTTVGPAEGGPERFDDPGLAEARLDVIDRLPPSQRPGTRTKKDTAAAIAAVLDKKKAQYRRRSDRFHDAADRDRTAWVAALGEALCQPS